MNKNALAAALLCAGCASTQSVLESEPTEIIHSDKSQNEVAFCMANKNHVSPLDRDDGSKVVLIKNSYGGLSFAFTIWPTETGSRIEYRRSFGTIGAAWKQCL